ncbi:hypothetical protein KIW84_056117 [Lathyrus oleraceus]|uniref:Copia protein n=1 Tax=Pisum sativum TaxID=3888 RepID=A0A9D4WXA9_PEA|nr:hypothetical protein KIW84_056117 [Pisum sativum]
MIALSRIEVEYIIASKCSTHIFSMKSQLKYYQLYESNIPILGDNISAIYLSKNPILHSKVKHIEMKHHFIRDYVHKGIINLKFIDRDYQWDDIFTKPFAKYNFFHSEEFKNGNMS